MIRDQIIHENNPNFLQTKCFCCQSKDHMVSNCPLLHYNANRIKTVNNYIKDPGQMNRTTFKRNPIRSNKFNSLFSSKYVQKCNENFRNYSNYYIDLESSGYLPYIRENLPYEETQIEYRKNRLKVNTNVERILESPLKQNNINRNIRIENDQEEEKDEKDQYLSENEECQSLIMNEADIEKFYAEKELEKPQFKIELKPIMLQSYQSSIQISKELPKKGSINELKSQTLQRSSLPNMLSGSCQMRQSQFMNNNNSYIKTMQELKYDEPDLIKDSFEQEFEKGANFSNYYKQDNLFNVLKRNQKVTRKNKELKLLIKNRGILKSSKNYKFLTKNNKIAPILEFKDEIKNTDQRKNELLIIDNNNIDNKRPSSIYSGSQKKKFFKQNNTKTMNFYDVVNEILYNNELRKKLQTQKNSEKNKKKQFL